MRRCSLFVCDGGTRGAAEWDHLGATKTDLPTPSVEVSTREVKRIAELDQHIERHQEAEGFAPSLAIDQVLANSS